MQDTNPKVASKFSVVNGRRVHYLVCGKGKPLVILHGYLTTAKTFSGLIQYLASYYKVYAPDFPGFGLSDELEGRTTFEESTKVIIDWIKQVKLQNILLMGVSMGGPAIIEMAKNIDELIRGYILLAPYYGAQTLLFPKTDLLKLKILTKFFNHFLPKFIGEKLWERKQLLLKLEKLLGSAEILNDRPDDQRLDALNSATYKAFWHTLDIILHQDLREEKQVSRKPAAFIMSKKDDTLDYAATIRGYRKIFPNLKESRINLGKHYPVEPITKEYIEKHFNSLLEEIVDYFEKRIEL